MEITKGKRVALIVIISLFAPFISDNIWNYNGMLNGYQESSMGVEPIPLTPEILEKNVFYRSEIPTRDEIGHYYHRKTDPSSIFVSMSFDDGRDFGNEIKYVHQLQHALRLCGIDKEIEV